MLSRLVPFGLLLGLWTAPRTWTVGDIVTAAMMNALRDDLNAIAPLTALTFPGSPADNDRAILVDSLTNPTYQWEFCYNASSTSPYKWEVIGSGTPIVFAGASTTLPAHAGDYLILAKGNSNEAGGTTTGADETATLTVGGVLQDSTTQNGPSTAASGGGVRGTVGFTLAARVNAAASGATVVVGGVNGIPLNTKILISPFRLS